MTTRPDEDILRDHLEHVRSEARMYGDLPNTNPDTHAIYQDMSKRLFEAARALHRMMETSGIRGLGPLNY